MSFSCHGVAGAKPDREEKPFLGVLENFEKNAAENPSSATEYHLKDFRYIPMTNLDYRSHPNIYSSIYFMPQASVGEEFFELLQPFYRRQSVVFLELFGKMKTVGKSSGFGGLFDGYSLQKQLFYV